MDTASRIQTLEQLVASLREEVVQLRLANAQWRLANAQWRLENEQLHRENGQLREENGGLRREVERLRQESGGGKGDATPSFVKANKKQPERSPRKKRAAKHNRGRQRLPATRHEIHGVEQCPECGEQLGPGRLYYRREVIDIPPPQAVEVVEHQVQKGWCRRCRKWCAAQVNWTGIVLGSGRVGVRLLGLVAYMRAMLRVPLRTLQQYVATVHQVTLSVGEISRLCRQAVAHLANGSAALKAQARASPVLHMDETGWREDGQNGYIWCLATDTPQPVRYYEYHRSRSGDVALALLDGYGGHLVTDFYAAYNKYMGPHQRCWVHLLRDLRALRAAQAANGEVVAWALGVKLLYREAREQLAAGLSATARLQLAERLQRMAELLGLQYALAYDHPCGTLAKRLLRHQDELFQFVRHAYVPADNNLAERALRPLVVQRKISGGSRSRPGSATRMALASLFETWQARQLNPLLACWRELGYEAVPGTA